MSDKINPLTGLPETPPAAGPATQETKINPLTGQVDKGAVQKRGITNRLGKSYDATRDMSHKDYKSFLDYGVNVTSGIDHVEARARNQSTAEKWGHGLMKAGVTAVGALGENTIGLVWGLGSVATGGSFYDHSFGRAIDSMNESMAEFVPNYYTRAEKNASTFSMTNLGSANFWADKVANGVGYVAGSIATDVALAYVSGGSSLTLTAARYATKFGKAAKVLTTAQKVKAVNNVYKTTKAVNKAKNVGKILDKTGDIAKSGGWKTAYARAENGLISAIGESNVEARQAKNSTLESLTGEWLENNPGKTEADIPDDVMQDFTERATAAGNTVFAINLPIVGGTNALTIGRMLGPGYRKSVSKLATGGDDALFNIGKASKGANVGKYVDTGLDGGWLKRTATKSYRLFKEPITSSASEAFQEGSQFFAGEFAQDYYTKKYADRAKPGSMIASMEHGLRQTFGTKEGTESMLIGAIIGGGTVGVTNSVRRIRGKETTYTQKRKNTQQALDILNSGVLTKPIENIQQTEQNLNVVAAMERALALSQDPNVPITQRKKAHKAYKDAQYQLIRNNAAFLMNTGRTDLVMEQLEDAKDLTDEEFKKEFGYQLDGKVDKVATIEKLKNRLNKHQETMQRIDQIAPAMQETTGLPRRLMSQEQLEQERIDIEANRFYRQALYNRSANIDGHTERLDNILGEMQALSGNSINQEALNDYTFDQNIQFQFEDVDGVAIEDGTVVGGQLREELERVRDSITNPLEKAEFQDLMNDFMHLTGERQATINSFEALTDNVNGPATAEFLKQRQEQYESYANNQQLNEEVDGIINNSEVPSDLDNMPANATEDQMHRAHQRRTQLGAEIAEEAKALLEGKTLEELEAIDIEALRQEEGGERKALALEMAIEMARNNAQAQENGEATPYDALNGDPSQHPDVTEDAANTNETLEEAESQDNGVKTQEELDQERRERYEEEQRKFEENTGQPSAVEGGLDIGIIDIGEFATDENGRIIVDENGNPGPSDNPFKTANGVDGRAALDVPTTGAPVTFELGQFAEGDIQREEVDWETAPILVRRNGVTIGILKPFSQAQQDAGFPSSSNRQQIVEAILAGKTVTATAKISKVEQANVSNVDGSPQFRSAGEVFDNPTLAIVTAPEFVPTLTLAAGEVVEPGMERALQESQSASEVGQVSILVKNPQTGEFSTFKASTQTLSPAAQIKALELAMQANLVDLQNLAGLNSMPFVDPAQLEDPGFQNSYLHAVNTGAQGESLVFHLPDTGLVRVYSNQLQGSGTINVEVVSAPVLMPGVENTSDRFTKIRTKAVAHSAIQAQIANILQNKKFQVDANLANNSEATFVNPMTGETVNYREYLFDNANPIVRVDASPQIGAYHNAGLEFSDMSIAGETKTETTTSRRVPTPPTADTSSAVDPKAKPAASPRRGKRIQRRTVTEAPAVEKAPAVVERTDPIDPRPISPENVFDVSKTDRNSDEAYQLERQSRTSPNLQKAKITDLVGKELVMEIRPGHTALQDKMGEGVKTMKIKVEELPGAPWGIGFSRLEGDYLGDNGKINDHYNDLVRRMNKALYIRGNAATGKIAQDIDSVINSVHKEDPNDFGLFEPSQALTNFNTTGKGLLLRLVEVAPTKPQDQLSLFTEEGKKQKENCG